MMNYDLSNLRTDACTAYGVRITTQVRYPYSDIRDLVRRLKNEMIQNDVAALSEEQQLIEDILRNNQTTSDLFSALSNVSDEVRDSVLDCKLDFSVNENREILSPENLEVKDSVDEDGYIEYDNESDPYGDCFFEWFGNIPDQSEYMTKLLHQYIQKVLPDVMLANIGIYISTSKRYDGSPEHVLYLVVMESLTVSKHPHQSLNSCQPVPNTSSFAKWSLLRVLRDVLPWLCLNDVPKPTQMLLTAVKRIDHG